MTNLDGLAHRIFADPNFYRPIGSFVTREPYRISMQCPHCGKEGIFDPIASVEDAEFGRRFKYGGPMGDLLKDGIAQFVAGLRGCPNGKCRGVVFIIMEVTQSGETLAASAPPISIHFRSENIPLNIAETLREAVASHSVQAYRASTIMVRRTLELLCNEKGAKGKNLKERIGNLGGHVILPPKLLEAADHLRLMGNDAAHVEAKDYDDIDKEHSEVAIDVAKRILEAVYQHDDIISRLEKLKKPHANG